MGSYKLKFENGRCCTVEADSKPELISKIKEAEERFSCACKEVGGNFIDVPTPAKSNKKTPKSKEVIDAEKELKKAKSSKISSYIDEKSKKLEEAYSKDTRKFATGGGSAPRWWNKQVRPYMFFVFNTETNKVWAGNEYQEDAKDELKEFMESNPKLPLKVLTKRAITNKKINPLTYENWARSTEQLDAIRKFADGGGVDDERYCRLANDTGKGINEGYVIEDGDMYFETEKGLVDYLRENYLPKSKLTDKQLLKKAYDDEYYYYTEWEGESEIEDQGYYYTEDGKEIELASKGKKMALGGSMMVASAVSNRLPETTSAIDKRLANRIYSERPSRWEDRGLKYGEGGVSSRKAHFYINGIAKDEPKEHQKFFKEVYSEKDLIDYLKKYNSDKSISFTKITRIFSNGKREDVSSRFLNKKFATGGTVGQEITFKHWSGDIRNGSITEDLGNGNFEVSSGFGSVLVNKNDIISAS
jgi:hypothetical protein